MSMINIFWQIPNGHGRFWLEWSFPARNSAWRSDINISMKLHSVNLQDWEKVVKSFGTPKMMVWYGYGSIWQIVKIVERLENSDEMLDRSIQFDMLAKFLLCRWYVIPDCSASGHSKPLWDCSVIHSMGGRCNSGFIAWNAYCKH